MTDTPNLPERIENVGTGISDETLSEIKSFSDAFSVLEKAGIVAENFADYGSGFVVLDTKDKARLCGVPFYIIDWRFNTGDNGLFVSAAIITKTDEKLILNDGSTGIRDQLRKITEQRIARGVPEPQKGLLVENGLTESRYNYTDPKTGESRPAVTYYLAN